MKLLPAVILIGGGLYVLSKISTASTASQLNFIISGYSFNQNGIYPTINVNVTAQNVTNTPLQFNALAANAYLNGTFIGNVAGFTPVTIAALSQAVIPLQVLANVTSVVSDVISILTGSAGVSAVLEIKGSANISNLIVPFDVTYNPL